VRSRRPAARTTVIHGCATAHAAEAMPPRRPSNTRLAHERSQRYACLRSGRRTGQCSHAHTDAARPDCPRLALGCQAMFRPPVDSATRSNSCCALPHLSAPQGAEKEGTGAAALCPCHCFVSAPFPRWGLCRSLRSGWLRLGVARGRTLTQRQVVLVAGVALAAGALAPVRAATPGTHGVRGAHEQDGHGGLAASAGRRACQAALGSRHCACRGTGCARSCLTRCGRGLACSVGATCPHTPRRSLRSMGGRVVFDCRAVCRGPCRPVLPRNPRMPA
jgi:hypothetical protein